MADFTFVDGNAPTATNWNTNVRDQLVVICTSSTRPAAPVTGRAIYETDTLREMRWDGATWVQVGQVGAWSTYTPTWTASTANPAIGNGALLGRYQRLYGRTWHIDVLMSFGSTTTYGTGTYSLSLPSGLTSVQLAVGSIVVLCGANYHFGVATASGSATTMQLSSVTSTSNTAMVGVSGTVPSTIGTGNSISISLTVESTT